MKSNKSDNIQPIMNIKSCFIIVVVIFIQSCKAPHSDIYEFDPRTIRGDEFTLSEIADDITYIPLDNMFPLDRIIKTIFKNDAIYLNYRNIGILEFDRAGKFKNKIGSIGRGPGEYITYMLFTVDDNSGRVYNVADRNELIQVFSRTGHLVRSFSLEEYGTLISGISFFNSNLFIQCAINDENSNYEWIIYDTLGNIINKQQRHIPKFTTNYGSIDRLPYIFESTLSYYNTWTDTVFSILPDLTEKPSMIISPGEHRFPRSYIPIEQIMQRKYFGPSRIFVTERFIVIDYYYKKYCLALIDKHNWDALLKYYEYDESVGYPISGIVNDLDDGSWFLPDGYFTEIGREYLVGLQYPYQIKARVTSLDFINSTPKYPDKKKEFEKLANRLKETDNPVLVLVRLKK